MSSPALALVDHPAQTAADQLVRADRLSPSTALILRRVGQLFGIDSGPWRGQALAAVRAVTGDPDALVFHVRDEADPWAVGRGDGTELGRGDDEVEALTDAIVRLAEGA